MSQKTVRLRSIYVDVGFYCRGRELDRAYISRLSNLREVLEVVLKRTLNQHPLDGVSHRNISVSAATEKRGSYRIASDSLLRLGVAHPKNDAIDEYMKSDMAYDHFMWLIEEAFRRESPMLADYYPFLSAAYESFRSDDHRIKWQLIRQKPRGQQKEFFLEALLDEDALSVDFVCNYQDTEVYREQVMQTGPYPNIMFKGALKKFEIDGNRIAISGRVPTKVPPSDLSLTKHGDVKDYAGMRLSHYNWSRELELVLGGCES